ncbi:hypothetical protein TNCT_680601 [Trichonephila clavata]|uniref:Uncharacterized protein n=1 Tax=Trichonephila clavata TaxID=2740835 RepID=A0A8X6FIX4_TRICU|nr:hypothetical protein TNCT_680601 [Trichonephila clavata]
MRTRAAFTSPTGASEVEVTNSFLATSSSEPVFRELANSRGKTDIANALASEVDFPSWRKHSSAFFLPLLLQNMVRR